MKPYKDWFGVPYQKIMSAKEDDQLTRIERKNFLRFCKNATDRQLQEIINTESEKSSEYHDWCSEAARDEQERRT